MAFCSCSTGSSCCEVSVEVNTKDKITKPRLGLEILALICFVVVGSISVLHCTSPTSSPEEANPSSSQEHLVEASYYQTLEDNTVQCQLCFRKCAIPEGGRGFCLTRENRSGKLYTLTYGQPVAMHIDSVEKELCFTWNRGAIRYVWALPPAT